MPRVLRSQKHAVGSGNTTLEHNVEARGIVPVVRVEKRELLSMLSQELVEKIGRKLNNLQYAGMWNIASALQSHGNARKQHGVCREFNNAVPMVNSMVLHGSLHSVSTLDLGPYDARHDPLIFSCIRHGMTHAQGSGKMQQIIRSVVQRFPAAISLQNSSAQSPLHFLLQYPDVTCNDLRALMPNSIEFEDSVLTSLNSHAQTPLLALLRCQRAWAIVPHLIDSNQDVLTMCDKSGSVPLHFCFYNIKEAICMRLFAALAAKANNRHKTKTLVAQDSKHETPLHVLLSQLELQAVRDMAVVLIPKLIDCGQKVLLLKNRKLVPGGNIDQFQTDTPLHILLKKHPHTVPFHTFCLLIDNNQEVLLERSSFCTRGQCDRDTPLHLAIKANMSFGVIRKLIDRDKDVLLIANGCDDLPLHTVLRTCTMEGDPTRHTKHSTVQYLMDQSKSKDPGIFARHGQFGDTVLHVAIRCNLSFRILSNIIETCPEIRTVANNARLSNDEAGDTPFHLAIKAGKSWGIIWLLIDSDFALLTTPNCFEDMPLHMAAICGSSHYVFERLLFYNNTMLLTQNMWGSTPLHLAIGSDCGTEILKLLMQNVEVLRITDACGNTPLHSALIQSMSLEQIRMFTPLSGQDLRLLANNKKNRSLHLALATSEAYTIDMIKFLSYNDMSDQNEDGMTPLHLAVKQRAGLDVLRLLCARPLFDVPQTDLRTVANNNGVIPLLTAIKMSLDIGRISFLIDQDRRMLFETDQDGHTPFHLAVVCQASVEVVALLFPGEGMQPDLRIQTNDDNNTPLTSAIQHGASLAVVQLCIDPEHQHALFIKSNTPHYLTPIQQYIQHTVRPWSMSMMQTLIDTNKKVLWLCDEHAHLPVYNALTCRCHEQVEEVVQTLFPPMHAFQALHNTRRTLTRRNNNIDKLCSFDGTLFHLVIYHRYDANVFTLLAKFLKPALHEILQRSDNAGNTPLLYALKHSLSWDIIALLIDPTTFAYKDHHNRTALHVAALFGAPYVVKLLLKNGASAWRLTPDKSMDLPLHVALQQSTHYTDSAHTPQYVKLLIDPLQTAILWVNQDGNTPLHLALSNISIHATLEFIAMLRLLVDPNGDVLGMTNNDGMTPFQMLSPPLHLLHGNDAEMVQNIKELFNTFPVMMQL